MAESELEIKLKRQIERNEGSGEINDKNIKIFNPYTEFQELTRKDIINFEKEFKK